MAYKSIRYCLYYSAFTVLMLLYQSAHCQGSFGKVDSWLSDNLEELGGRAVLMVYRDGKIIYSNQLNDLNRKQQAMGKIIARRTGKDAGELLQDYNENSRIAIASCSKWLSAALVMTFVDEHKLALTDTVGKFLPVMSANGKGNITIADCLSHMTGIRSGDLKESRELSSGSTSMDESIAKIAAAPMEAAPGTSFHYSSVGLQISAAVIEKISGKDFETLFRERIAVPCNMAHTDFGHKPVPLPAGGALSTASDYMNFLVMILNNGFFNGKQVLSKESVDLMQHNYVAGKKVIYSPAEAGDWGYGFGEWMMNDASGGRRSDAVTSPGLFGSFPWVDNSNQYAAVLFCFNLRSKGRNTRYSSLKKLVDEAITNK